MNAPRKINSISEFHKLHGLGSSLHPMISLVDYTELTRSADYYGEDWMIGYYSIGMKRNVGTMRYGQTSYDFDEGVMTFIAPGQVIRIEPNQREDRTPSGWLLLFHPDFILNSALAEKFKQYEFFGYSINEALFLSEREEKVIIDILHQIEQEYQSNIDNFSQDIILAHLDVLLTYAERFYHRQFNTRKPEGHAILTRLEKVLNEQFEADDLIHKGIPSVNDVANTLNLSPNYLSNLLKVHTGQSTQQHIHDKLIEKAKEKLGKKELSVSEVAYELGFEYSQSFSKLFKAKTNMSPSEFRNSLN
ncbi:helix-turn-helix domain-containing protein [Sanyastnella coralliicola]|uniref:helix-turn-helix domain-containing protein n=1 Tax=Sanyastnella coralliicola TaxID=3069118 RepID=UPI0027B9C9A4|nr:helix-turn-helix transcriptional regulator [Longitalea sp. SCSIO 12813]